MGERARVTLVRARYAHTKYVLLDDPLNTIICLHFDPYALVPTGLFVFSRLAIQRDFV